MRNKTTKTNYLPHYRTNREYESPLHEYRVARGWTVKDLIRHSGVHQGNIAGLANGMLAPVVSGKITNSAQKVAKALEVSIEDLFPRYFCKVVNADSFDRSQINNMSLSQYSLSISENNDVLPVKVFWKKIKLYLSPKQFEIIFLRHKMGYTLQEIANKFDLTRERIRQIEAMCFKRLKFKLLQEEL